MSSMTTATVNSNNNSNNNNSNTNIHPHTKQQQPVELSSSAEPLSKHKATAALVLQEQGKDIQQIWPNSNTLSSNVSTPTTKSDIILYPLEYTQSNPLPNNRPVSSSSSALSFIQQIQQKRHSSTNSRRRSTTTIPDLGNLDAEEQAALESDILARRQLRRASTRKEYEEVDDDSRVAIGIRVSEGHRNYQLMYNMLTGIRIAVGRVSAKIKRDLTDDDFSAAHKLVFDVVGNELTPGVKYDFKFKDYAPWVFRYLREEFHIDAADYMMSLTNKYILSELGSPGKSGSFFYYSKDYRFIIKTLHHTEHKFMRKVLKQYYEHVADNPNTLLCRFYGLHRIKLPRGTKIHFVVMGNVFPGNKDVHETYDLKGSTFGRVNQEDKNPHAVLKDLNWVEKHRKLEFDTIKRNLFISQLHRDVELLAKLNIMDYSLLIGIHDIVRGNKEGIRDNSLHIVTHDTKKLERSLSRNNRRESKADILKKAIKRSNPVQLDSSQLPEMPSDERKYCIFYSEEGGFKSIESDKVYFLGVIDILTPYNLMKKAEHFFKSFTQNKNTISAVDPVAYGERFIQFMENVVTVNTKKEQ